MKKSKKKQKKVKLIDKKRLLGTWILKSFTYPDSEGNIQHYMGENAQGILIYTPHNLMSAQLMHGERQKLSTDDWVQAPLEEIKDAFRTYQAYYGRYELNEANATITHYVDACVNPNWHLNKNKEERYLALSKKGKTLTITTPPIMLAGSEKIFTLVWTKEHA